MADRSRWRRLLQPVLSIGAYPGEPELQRSGRQVVVVAFIIATLSSIPTAFQDLAAGYTWVGILELTTIVLTPPLFVAIARWPRRFETFINLSFVFIYAVLMAETAMFGGLWRSGLIPLFPLNFVLVALLAMSVPAALWWFGAFVAGVIFGAVIPNWVGAIYLRSDPTGIATFNIIGTGLLTIAVLAYFVRQRDRFQRRSDDLLRNVLPDDIVVRLKDGDEAIADDIPSASVLFADVVDFTPMSAQMAPGDLVGLLDELFTIFDAFVEELGLEKIKTVGDAYMVAAGIPRRRADHAHAIAELALRIRDHVATTPVAGRHLSLRIGISSGPVTAGIIGTHKFAYDLWGDTVNVASRMESSGVPGSIQISPESYDLLKDAYVCEPRGLVDVKGKSPMETYLLSSRRASSGAPT
jgi:class 3 adenylate cyclase